MGARHFSLLVATALIAFALGATAQVERTVPVQWLGPYLGPLPGTEPDGVSVVLADGPS